MRCRLLVAMLFCSLMASSGSAASQEITDLEADMMTCLDWHPAAWPDCPTEEQITSSVEEVVGHRVLVGNRCDRVVHGMIEHRSSSEGWAASLTLETSNGSPLGDRQLIVHDPSCAALTGPVALVVALMVEATKSHVILNVRTETRKVRAPNGALDTERRSRSFAGLAASWGILPEVALGPHLGFGLSLSRFISVQVEGSVWLPDSTHRSGRGGEFWAWYTGSLLCPELTTTGAINLELCAGVQAGKLYGSGTGLDYVLSPSRPYLHAEARAAGSVRLFGPLALSAYFGAAVSLVRPRFVYVDPPGPSHEVHRPNAAVLIGGIGFELWSVLSGEAGATSP